VFLTYIDEIKFFNDTIELAGTLKFSFGDLEGHLLAEYELQNLTFTAEIHNRKEYA